MPIDKIIVGTMREEVMRQDVMAQNLANVSTSGYKRMLPFNDGGGFRTVLDRTQGTLSVTGGAMHVSIKGDGGWFVLSSNGRQQLTRDGSFQMTADGTLTSADGRPVQGRGGGDIKLDPRAPVDVGEDGSIHQNGQRVAQLLVVDPGAAAALQPAGRASYEAPGATFTPMNATVTTGHVEMANVNPMHEMTDYMMSMRSFEFGQKSLQIDNEIQRLLIRDVGRTK